MLLCSEVEVVWVIVDEAKILIQCSVASYFYCFWNSNTHNALIVEKGPNALIVEKGPNALIVEKGPNALLVEKGCINLRNCINQSQIQIKVTLHSQKNWIKRFEWNCRTQNLFKAEKILEKTLFYHKIDCSKCTWANSRNSPNYFLADYDQVRNFGKAN